MCCVAQVRKGETVKRFRSNGVKDAGYSLAELLVAITLFTVVVGITGTVIVQAHQATRRASSAALTQAQLLDTVTRMSREVAMSDPITFASATKLETLTVRGTEAVRTQFEYVVADRQIVSRTSTATVPNLPADLTSASEHKIIASDVNDLEATTEKLLTYVDSNNDEMASTATPAERGKVARVKINLQATLKDRSKPLTVETSMATRLGMPAGWGPSPDLVRPNCPAPSSSRTATVVTLSWAPLGATGFQIVRTPSWGTGPLTQTGTTLTDTGVDPSTQYTYSISGINGAGEGLACDTIVLAQPLPVLPVLAAYPANYNDNTVSWTNPVGAPPVDHYEVSYSNSEFGTYTPVQTVDAPATSWQDTDAARTALGGKSWYKVQAFSTADTSPASPVTSGNQAMQYPVSPVTAAVLKDGNGTSSGNSADNKNHIAWGNQASASRYQVYYAQKGNFSPIPLLGAAVISPSVSYDHTAGVALGSRFEYFVVGYNSCHSDADDPQNGTDCASPNVVGGPATPVLDAEMAQIYQRPPPLDPTVFYPPDLNTNYTQLDFVRNGDEDSNPATPRFCDEPPTSRCGHEVTKSVNGGAWTNPPAGLGQNYEPATRVQSVAPPLDDASDGGDWGQSFAWRIRSFNPGGFSDYSTTDTTKTYPAPFAVTANDLRVGLSAHTNGVLSFDTPNTTQLTWGQSYGIGVTYQYRPSAAAAFTAYGATMSTAVAKTTAGEINTYTINAKTTNGMVRPLNWRVQSAPGGLKSQSTRYQCRNNEWRMKVEELQSMPYAGPLSEYSVWTNDTFERPTGMNMTAMAINSIDTTLVSDGTPNAVGKFAGVYSINYIYTKPGTNVSAGWSFNTGIKYLSPGVPLHAQCATFGATWKYPTATGLATAPVTTYVLSEPT